MALVDIEGVSLIRDGRKILDSVTLGMERGECAVVMGFSGSGSSILLKTAAGILCADEGRVLAYGEDLQRLTSHELFLLRGKMGFAFQDAALWANMSGFQNMALPLQFHRPEISGAEIREKILAMAREFDFRGNLARRPVDFSNGERKLISLMRAMILGPEILFLDDPSGAVDNASSERILHILKKRKAAGVTLLIATYNPRYTSHLADTLVVLKEGRVAEAGPFSRVRASREPYVRAVLSENLSEALSPDTQAGISSVSENENA